MQTDYTVKDIEKFWGNIDKVNSNNFYNGTRCWIWETGKTTAGYGTIRFGYYGKHQYAHRVSWILAYGIIPNKMEVCHKCDNPACCNPDHLFLGTHKENMIDRNEKNRVQHGEKHYKSKLSDAKIEEIRARYVLGKESQYALAEIFGVGQDHISRIVNKKRWKKF